MADFPIAGANVRVSYGWESTFGSEAGSIDKAFSHGLKITALDIDNTVEYIYGLGSQSSQASVVREFKGTWGVEFILSDPWWLRAILGGLPADGGATPYTHTYDAASGISNEMTALSIDVGFDLDTDSHNVFLGCVCNTMTLTGAVGEPVRVRLDGSFINQTKDTTLESLVAPVEDPFTFAQASFEIPNGTTIADVQSVEMSFNRNTEMIWGLGSRYAQKNVAKQREWNIRITATYEDDDQFFDDLIGSTTAPTASPAEVATCELTISNGGAGSAMRKFVFLFANVRVERGSRTASVDGIVNQDITLRARQLESVVVSNNTQNAL